MKKRTFPHGEMELYPNHAILRIFENEHLCSKKARSILKELELFFNKKYFVLISHRTNHYTVDKKAFDEVKSKYFKAFGVVSTLPNSRDRAIEEQRNFPKNFAFFEDLQDAIEWSKTFY
jgi:hypothetical protein